MDHQPIDGMAYADLARFFGEMGALLQGTTRVVPVHYVLDQEALYSLLWHCKMVHEGDSMGQEKLFGEWRLR